MEQIRRIMRPTDVPETGKVAVVETLLLHLLYYVNQMGLYFCTYFLNHIQIIHWPKK